ncbi:hypothetical protein DFQ28_005698 [Apophysomyces sp. BC1034]|nr:hypothetical protein DFQ30_002111 [Apophysomyces sp. BC1015]KAG0179417.1 hypothetical protein DFQ29_002103 [Apophysomyces sp. BC1021]KAG0187884.1 hypothetical protein DFQ28_005698 [Apophysomyces sp. BC1034]
MNFADEKKSETVYQNSVTHEALSEEVEYTEVKDVDRSQAGSSFYAYVNVVCVIAGTGTLGLPYALKQGGWIGLMILGLSWIMSIYTGTILIRCLYANGKERMMTYKDIATASFGVIGGWVTFFFNTWILLGAPILYMVLSGQNLNQLCKGTAAELGDTPWIIISCAIVAVPFILVKSMREVAIMSAFGAAATLITVLIVLVMACIDQKNLTNIQHNSVIWEQFPIALSTISFSFGGNVVYPHVEASMKKPKQWPMVLALGLSTCALMYFLTAVPGYAIYGTTVISPIYNRIPVGAGRMVAIILMTIHVLTASPILVTSFSLDVEDMCSISVERFGKWKEFAIRAVLRTAVMVFVGVVACVVPHFDLLMSLIGAFANCALIFVFPILFYFRLTGFRNKPLYELAFCAVIVLLGIVGLIFGTKEAIEALIVAFKEGK